MKENLKKGNNMVLEELLMNEEKYKSGLSPINSYKNLK